MDHGDPGDICRPSLADFSFCLYDMGAWWIWGAGRGDLDMRHGVSDMRLPERLSGYVTLRYALW